jgi:hypothetical protein
MWRSVGVCRLAVRNEPRKGKVSVSLVLGCFELVYFLARVGIVEHNPRKPLSTPVALECIGLHPVLLQCCGDLVATG